MIFSPSNCSLILYINFGKNGNLDALLFNHIFISVVRSWNSFWTGFAKGESDKSPFIKKQRNPGKSNATLKHKGTSTTIRRRKTKG